jgi:hypothetical protein
MGNLKHLRLSRSINVKYHLVCPSLIGLTKGHPLITSLLGGKRLKMMVDVQLQATLSLEMTLKVVTLILKLMRQMIHY